MTSRAQSFRSVRIRRLDGLVERFGARWLSRIATVGLAISLALLAAILVLGSIATVRAISLADDEAGLSGAFSDVETALLLAKRSQAAYVSASDPAQTARASRDYQQAGQDLAAAVGRVRRLGGPQDRALASYIEIEMRRFDAAAQALFDLVDADGVATSTAVRSRTDESLDSLETLVIAAATTHRARTTVLMGDLTRNQQRQRLLGPLVLVVASAFLILCWGILLLLQGRLGRQAEQERWRADHDFLTGLLNRAGFTAALNQELDRAAAYGDTVTLIMLDLNNFKPVNDEFGHDVGDELLQHVAGRLLSLIRVEDHAARLGGDEFALIVVGPASEALKTRLVEVCRRMAEPYDVQGQVLVSPASMGAAVAADDGMQGLIRRADLAMYQAKADKTPGNGQWQLWQAGEDDEGNLSSHPHPTGVVPLPTSP